MTPKGIETLRKHETFHILQWPVLLHIVFPLCVGGMIYLCFRNDNLMMFVWLEELGILKPLYAIRTHVPDRIKLPHWVLYNLPDATWMWSLTSFTCYLWKGVAPKKHRLYVGLAVALGLSTEIAQYFALIRGQFDWCDFVAMSFASALAYTFVRCYTVDGVKPMSTAIKKSIL